MASVPLTCPCAFPVSPGSPVPTVFFRDTVYRAASLDLLERSQYVVVDAKGREIDCGVALSLSETSA